MQAFFQSEGTATRRVLPGQALPSRKVPGVRGKEGAGAGAGARLSAPLCWPHPELPERRVTGPSPAGVVGRGQPLCLALRKGDDGDEQVRETFSCFGASPRCSRRRLSPGTVS